MVLGHRLQPLHPDPVPTQPLHAMICAAYAAFRALLLPNCAESLQIPFPVQLSGDLPLQALWKLQLVAPVQILRELSHSGNILCIPFTLQLVGQEVAAAAAAA